MAKYRVTSPDGQIYEVNAPEGATESEIMNYARLNFGQSEINQPAQHPPIGVPTGDGVNVPIHTPAPIEATRDNTITGTDVERDIRSGVTGPVADWFSGDNKGGTLAQRATGGAAFLGSLPLRMVTQGKIGLQDVLPEAIGKPVGEAERGFVDRNSNLFQALNNVGTAAAFLPNLASIGRPPGIHGGVRSGPVGTRTGRGVSYNRATQGGADLESFNRQGVRPFGPAFNQGPVASVAKQLTETPLVGAPLRNALDETFTDTARAVGNLADDVAPSATHEMAGTAVQRGLDRFRAQGFSDLEPQTIQAMGINPMSPVQRPQGGGAAQMQRINQGQGLVNQVTGGTVQTSRGANAPLPQTRVQKLNARTQLDDLSNAELARVVRTPADQTSFTTRLEALYERAFRGIPPLLRRDGSVDPMLLPTANSGSVVRDIVGNEARTGITAGLQNRYGQMFETLSNPRANIPLQTLREMRTAIGRELSNFGLYEASLDRTQLRRLYGGLSSDIEVGLQDIATRAAQATQGRGNQGLTVQQARSAAQSLRDIQVADRYARMGFERMDRFLSVVKQKNPQQAAAALVRAATEGGTGNMRMFTGAMQVLRPEERHQFGSLIVREMGRATDGARGIIQETGFSPSKFVTSYSKMSQQARNEIFTPNHQAALNDLFNVSNRLANVEVLANTSRSATNAVNLGSLGAAGAAAMSGMDAMLTFGGTAGGMAAASILMSRPAYARWMVGYMRARAAVRSGTNRASAPLVRQVSALRRMAQNNTDLLPAYAIVMQDAFRGDDGEER